MKQRTLSIMYSGGLDSLIAYHYAKAYGYDPVCINVDFGQPYNVKEEASLYLAPNLIRLSINGLYKAIESRMTNQIIPSRNVLLAVIGSMFSNNVWINALDGEQNGKEHDKSPRFFSDASILLSYTNEFFQERTLVESPFSDMSKAEIIQWGLLNGVSKEKMFVTSSCYDPSPYKCGRCLTCVKRYLAFMSNNITEPGYISDPLASDYYKELCREIPKANAANDYSRFTKKRIDEFLKLQEMLG
jgi:7-cyano-7-deazaguanine synthase in queuosine biosynthesis